MEAPRNMSVGSVPNPILVSILAFLFFFTGLIWFPGLMGEPFLFQTITFVAIFTVIFVLSFFSRHPLSGIQISIFISIAFICGHISSVVFRLIFFSFAWIGDSRSSPQEYISNNWARLINPVSGSLPSILSAILGLVSLGLLAGLIGYVFKNLSPLTSESYPLVFRDYWSQIKGFRKSQAQEYSDWDRRLAGWSIRKGSWIQRIRRRAREPRQELIFLPKPTPKESVGNLGRGDLYDVSSNKTVGEFVDYNDVISKYIPKLIHDPSDIVNMMPVGKRVCTPPTLGELFRRIAKDVGKSRITIVFFLIPLLMLVFGSASYFYTVNGTSVWFLITLVATGVPSVMIFALTYGFWKKSQDLVKIRPDESALILSIYLCLFLVFPIIVWILLNAPSTFFYNIPLSWISEWFWGWTVPFLSLSAILGFGYIFIHRETETINTYFFDNRTQEKGNSEMKPFNETERIPWIEADKETEHFWVIRFLYYWAAEFTLPKPHNDWERVELWVDAKTGALKWVVSDYHYRELWYKIDDPHSKPLPDLFVKIWPNFHTPIPIVNYDEASSYYSALSSPKRDLLRMIWRGFQMKLSREYRKQKKTAINSEKNRAKVIDKTTEELGPGVIATVIDKLNCTHIRYIKGVECKDTQGGLLYQTKPSS
jgi:hypothetical protein